MILEATHTHLYPGQSGRVSGPSQVSEIKAGSDCLVEFSDGSVAPARISKSEKGWLLDTVAYYTAAGTRIAQKRWLVLLAETGGRVEFRILKKIEPAI